MGRSRGGLTTKIHAVTDARGLPITLKLTAGQAHDGRAADDMLGTIGAGQTLLADAAYDSNRLRDRLAEIGAKAVIRPIRRRTAPPPLDRDAYRRRNRIERFFSKLKHYRAIATRYEKQDANFLALIKLAHGVQYMPSADLAMMFFGLTGNFVLALILALVAALVFGLLLEFLVFRHLCDRDHLDHVIATFGIILFLNQAVKLIWGAAPLSLPVPEALSGSVALMPGVLYPVWRLVIIGTGLVIALLLYVLVTRTRIGMLVCAGATDADMVSAPCWPVSAAS